MRIQSVQALYNTDFAQWSNTQAQLLKEKRFDEVDWENLIEEIEGLGRSDRRALRSHVRILVMHLLKWQLQPTKRSRSWESTITNARRDIEDILDDSPSLRGYLEEALWSQFPKVRKDTAQETRLPIDTFPTSCPYEVVHILSQDWFPK